MEAGWWLYSYNRFETTNMTINIEEARKRAFYKQPQTWTRLYMALSVVYTRSSAGFTAIARWRAVTISFAQLFPCSTSLGATSPCTPGRPSAIHYEDNRETKLKATNNVFSEKRVCVCWTWDQSRSHFLHVYNNRKEVNWAIQVITNPNKSVCCTVWFVFHFHCMLFRHCLDEGWYNISFDIVLQFRKSSNNATIYPKATNHHSLEIHKDQIYRWRQFTSSA